MINPYEVLGVCREDTDDEIKLRYKNLVKKWHSDQFHAEDEIYNAEVRMKEINEAYDMLKTPEKRSAYDMANPVSKNVYEYYAKKKTEDVKRETKDSADIEMEKQRKAVVQFLDVEYEHKEEILETLQELATGAVNNEFSDEEYAEYLDLVFEELEDCISKIREIVLVAKKREIKGIDANLRQAQDVIDELVRKQNETPKSLKEAHYVEETRLLTEKIYGLMAGFCARVNEVAYFDLLDKTWEFENDSQLNSVRKTHKKKTKKLLKDMRWVQETARERNIELKPICFGDSDAEYEYQRDERPLEKCIEIVEENSKVLNVNLKGLREEFWKTRCNYEESDGKKFFVGFKGTEDYYRGNFICPPSTIINCGYVLSWLKNIECITIPDYAIDDKREIELPLLLNNRKLKKIVFTFGEISHTVDISKIDAYVVTRRGDYICVKEKYWYADKCDFAFIDAKGVYTYDTEKLCKLNGVTSIKQLGEIWQDYKMSKGYELKVHAWAQVVKKFPDCRIMKVFPTSLQIIKGWVKMDKRNFEEVFLKTCDELKTRVIRLYIALGALKEGYCHEQAEWLISKLDVSKMYRSRLERFPNEMKFDEDPVFSVPRSAVDLIQENVDNEEFLPYVFAFLEGYNLFRSEANKAQVKLLPEFIIYTAPQYIFHKKVEGSEVFKKQLLDSESEIYDIIADRILNLYNVRSISKNIVETVDRIDSEMRYRFVNIESLESYLIFERCFKLRWQRTFWAVEAENVFLSNNSHAIEIIDDENQSVATVILNLFDEGELFADIVWCSSPTIEVLEAVKRALVDQMNCNSMVTAISIGMNEAPRTHKYNYWRYVVKKAKSGWLQNLEWVKFEIKFESRILGASYKGYRVRFMIAGKGQYFDEPNPYNPYRRKRRYSEYWF